MAEFKFSSFKLLYKEAVLRSTDQDLEFPSETSYSAL